jgi:hypothetical protein
MYLSNHDSFKVDHPLERSTKAAAVKYGITMMKRLFDSDIEVTTSQQVSTPACPKSATNLHERLKSSIGSVQDGYLQREEVTGDQIKKLFDQYDRHHVRGPQLDKFYDALCSIQPTSTQSERNFSLAASIATPKRSRMSSDKLNAVCFLKSYFMNQK